MKLLVVELKPDAPTGCLSDFPRPKLNQVIENLVSADHEHYAIFILNGGLSDDHLYYLTNSPHVVSWTPVKKDDM
jgi:hypothetical protein